MSDAESTTTWVTVAEAAEKAQVDSGTVRQWYRAGRIPTRRSEGERGAFLVPLDLVLELVQPPEGSAAAEATPSIEDALRGLSSDYWSAETESVKQQLAAANGELAEAQSQLEFLRSQLAEVSAENRALKDRLESGEDQYSDLRRQLADAIDDRKGVEARLATVEAELTQLRRTAARSSITDPSWLDLQTPAYQSPVRRQAMAPPPPPPSTSSEHATPPADGPTAPFEVRTSDLSDLLAATRPDDDEDGGGEDRAAGADRFADDGWGDADETAASRAIWTDEAPHPPLGENPDDLLPDADRKGRFGKR